MKCTSRRSFEFWFVTKLGQDCQDLGIQGFDAGAQDLGGIDVLAHGSRR